MKKVFRTLVLDGHSEDFCAPIQRFNKRQDGARLQVRFDADGLDLGELRPAATTDTLQNIRANDAPQTITLDLGPRFGSFRAADQPAPAGATRIVIDLSTQPDAAAPGTPVQPTAPETPSLLDLPQLTGPRTIVVDPGHGGDDAGAKGAQGTAEKSVTLSVGRRR